MEVMEKEAKLTGYTGTKGEINELEAQCTGLGQRGGINETEANLTGYPGAERWNG